MQSPWNMAATSKAEEDAVTGLGANTAAVGLRGCMVVKLTIGMGTLTGVLTVLVWENGIGESAMAPTGYLYARSVFPSEDIDERAC
jgi:hypothetical protein